MRSEEFYDQLSNNYSSLHGVSKHYLAAIDRVVASHIDGARSWLDVGTGDGLRAASIVDSLHRPPRSITLCDSSLGMVKTARQHLPSRRVVRWTLEEDPPFVANESFQFITLLGNVLGHIHPQTARLNQLTILHQLMDDDGILLLDFNNRWNVRAYGTWNAGINILRDLVHQPRATFTVTKSINGELISTPVYIGSVKEYRTLLNISEFNIDRIIYFNYASGKSEWVFTGQGFIEASKKEGS